MGVQVLLKGMNLSKCCYYIDWHEVQALCPVYQCHGGDLSEIQRGYLMWSGTVSDLQGTQAQLRGSGRAD